MIPPLARWPDDPQIDRRLAIERRAINVGAAKASTAVARARCRAPPRLERHNVKRHPGILQLSELRRIGARINHHEIEVGQSGEVMQRRFAEFAVIDQQHPARRRFQHPPFDADDLLLLMEGDPVFDRRGGDEGDVCPQ